MRAVVLRVGQPPVVEDVDTSLKGLQALVGGTIELLHLPGFVVVMNQDGRMVGLPFNRKIAGHALVGDLVCVSWSSRAGKPRPRRPFHCVKRSLHMALFEVTIAALLDGEAKFLIEADDPEDARDRALDVAFERLGELRWDPQGLNNRDSVEVEQVVTAAARPPVDRVDRVIELIAGYAGEDDQRTNVVDVLTDLRHLAAEARWDFDALLATARAHASAEKPS